MNEITAYTIIKKYLKENNFDGLCMEDCGCGFDDFAPADCVTVECAPAYKRACDCGDCHGQVFMPNKEGEVHHE